ncbi:connectin-like [Pectinophora gossypiella]|uniref:LRRCT domain-containing protein n=1 Tax=Pectinophora gossypiella TaxID=13191 RepID=A0A1E1WN65_PECGO|nr:connectin-like [Pectinophora gossypiella]
MSARRILTLIFVAFVLVEGRWHQKRDTTSICDPSYNNPSKLLCYCVKDIRQQDQIRSADCYLTAEDVQNTDHAWDSFGILKTVSKLTITNTRGISLKYIPTHALRHLEGLILLDIKYGNIETIHPYAFSNLSSIEEISLRDSQIKVLEAHAFAHHKDLTEIKLDKNNIIEINRDVFIDLPSLERLFLTSNQITTIHDKAFVHLGNLRELEINENKLFSLNSETFSGLKKLLKLDLSNNNLEVIGDNTFLPLKNLQTLNLEGNKIQMLDEKAFKGLVKLYSLSLAHNKLSHIENVKTFEGLDALKSLSLRANNISELKSAVMDPLMKNLNGADGRLDIEDNNFPCSCELEWFMALMNRTRSKNLKISMENLKCMPDSKLRDKWTNLEETEKNSGMFEVDETQSAAEYEYYDESQLNGKLFYTDVRDLICNTDKIEIITKAPSPTVAPQKITTPTLPTTKKSTTAAQSQRNKPIENIPSHGVLDLSVDETTPKPNTKDVVENEIAPQKKPDSYTTTRLVTVSAKPIEKKNVYEDMASDEAKPDKLKAQRSLQDEYKGPHSDGHKNAGCVALISLICFRLFH